VCRREVAVILQISKGRGKIREDALFEAILTAAVTDTPGCPNRDSLGSGDTVELVDQCCKDGFKSVMIDGRTIRMTRT